MLDRINYYLHHETERKEIAYNGYKEVLSKHIYEHRAKEMLEKVFGV